MSFDILMETWLFIEEFLKFTINDGKQQRFVPPFL